MHSNILHVLVVKNNLVTDNRCKHGGGGRDLNEGLCVSVVSVTESSENNQHKRKMKWREERSTPKRDAPTAKNKSHRKITFNFL